MIMAMAAEGGLSKDVYSDAAVVLRDELIEQFNRAQPKTPGGQAWPLAVLPYGHQMPALFSDDPEFFETINRIEFCRVGIHPRLLPEIEAALGHWREHSLPAIRKQAPTIADSLDKLAFTLLDEDTRSFNELALKSTDVSSHRIRQRVQNAYLDFHKLLNSRGRNFSESVLEEARAWVDFIRSPEGWNTAFGRAHYGIFASYEAAGHVITGHPQAQEQIASLAEKNRRLLMSAADLAGVDRAVLESCDHPLNIILKIVEQNGISNCDRAETMARIGLDLSRNIEILGELIAMQGVSLDMVHRSQHLERISSEEEQIRRDHEQMNAPMQAVRMEAFSGIIRRQGERLPFQIALLDQRDNALSPEAIQVLSNNHSPLLSTKSRLQSSSLGRLADLNNTVKIEFGPALEQEGQLIRPESIAKIEPTVYGFTDIEPNSVDAFRSIGAGFSAYNILQPVAEVKGIGNTPKEALQDTLERNKTILLTGVPAWELDQRLVDQVRSAIALMAEDSKPLSKLANKDRLVQSVLEELKSALNPEILVLAIKATPKKIKWINHVVTKDELEKVNFDRRIAAEYGLLKIKSKNPSVNKTWKYHATLDLANVLRPEAIRYLNELASRDRNLESAANKTKGTKSRGARQDRGTVAGLAIKDLRGNREKVLKRLLDATAEEQARFISKTKLWEAPDWQFLRAPSEEDRNNGERPMDPVVASFFNDLRKAISPKPPANIPEINQLYARLVLGLRDTFNEIRKQDELVASLKKGGEIYELVSSIKQECHAQGWRVNLIFGESLWRLSQDSADAANMVFRYEFDKAFRDTKQNTEWTIKEAIPRTGRGPVSNADEDENEALEDDSRKTGAMPMLSRLVRENAEDYRGGFDVSEEDVIQTFGFSGIEYGKSMNQADRTAYLNHAYDSFLDLSKLLNVPPKALSLGGTLGLAFGSRGRGGKRAAVAHFEPANNAINLTRMKGAGSMAHEYGHALANYFYRISRGVQGSRAPGDITKLLDSQLATEAVSAGQLREPVAQAVVEVLKSLKYREPDDIKELPDSWFAQGAVQADLKDGRKLDNPYWSSIEEMFARAFETYVQIALEEKFPGFRNDFLVRSDKLNHWGDQPYLAKEKAEKQLKESYEKYGYMLSDIRQKVSEELGESSAVDDRVSEILKEREAAHSAKRRRQLYPSGFERENMKKAFDRLFETLKLKDIEVHHEHLGRQDMPVMYSSASGLVERIDEKDHQILAACVFQEVARMCGEKVRVRWRDEIRDEVGALAAGRYISQTKAADTVKGVIEISLSAGLHTAHHEAFHFAQDHLLLREEQTMLDRFFARDAELTHRLINVLAEQGRNDAVAIVQCDPREAQAYAYEEWVKGNLDVRIEEPPVGVFGRINSIFTRTVNLCRKTGFRTPEQLFKAFYSGMLREREEELAAKHNQSDSNKQQWIDATQHTVLNSCEDIDALSSNRELDWPHSSAQLH
ncbi:hypothetical protein BTO32_15235 [Marinobacter lutaoensis]|uniref:Large polyvalent protein-associated domain-containing protein n=2 Tax=Marinobacter lutaoensis TaxID=135739 RepID=A0A1V2DPV1_9GAMM|nr:hypothetical protein BTO32_15235 [Marinobacter lutaoensis]